MEKSQIKEIEEYVKYNYPNLIVFMGNNSITIKEQYKIPIFKSFVSYESIQDRENRELKENEKKVNMYLYEFDLLNCRTINNMNQFLVDEENMWRRALEIIHDEPNISNDIVDLFKNPDEYTHNEEVYVEEWEWKHNGKNDRLINMYAYPGGNQAGAIFLNSDIVLINNDANIEATYDTPQELVNRIEAFTHIIYQQCMEDEFGDPTLNPHKHCINIRKRTC